MRVLLLASTALAGASFTTVSNAQEVVQTREAVAFDIPAQDLGAALVDFARQSGLRLAYPGDLGAGTRVAGLRGNYRPDAALGRLLAGSGLTWQFSGPNSVTVSAIAGDGAQADFAGAADGVVLDTLVVSAGGSAYWDGAPDAVYNVTANVDVIRGETISNYQISTPSDVLRGTTGALSGDSRNSGSLNVNIHGLQGQGRVPVTVDGAENNTTVYRGYQGIADRTFIDPDFISSVAIEKGASTARPGIGGAVSVTTVTVDDIIKDGRKSGFRFRLSASGNTSDPVRGTPAGQGGARPSFLKPTGGSASLAYGYRGDFVDLVAAISTRDTGNYHAGSEGPTEGWVYTQYGTKSWGPRSVIAPEGEVVNSSNITNSALAKMTFKFSDDLKWQVAASKYNTQFGEIMPSRYTTLGGVEQWRMTETDLDSLTSRVRWNPNAGNLVDIRWNLWRTSMDTQSAPIFDTVATLPESGVTTLGTDVSNTARFHTGWGDIVWVLGGAFKDEDARIFSVTNDGGSVREGTRREAAVFTTGEWRARDWLSFNAGLRYTRAETTPKGMYPGPERSGGVFDKSIGVSVKPNDTFTFFANYRHAGRLASLYEETLQAGNLANPLIEPERVHNIDIGLNAVRDNLFGDDSLRVKLAYFDSNVDNYIARNWGRVNNIFSIYFVNIDQARFRGFDLSTDYERKGFAAKFGATYYSDVEFCYLGDCGPNGLGTDYAKNQIPPKLQLSLDLSQKVLQDRLTLGGRVSRMGARASDDPARTLTSNMLIAPVSWQPYTLVDLYAHYDLSEDMRLSFDVQNITDEYFIEPLSLSPTPGPGRTARVMLDYRF